jgi:hypothetical protein
MRSRAELHRSRKLVSYERDRENLFLFEPLVGKQIKDKYLNVT